MERVSVLAIAGLIVGAGIAGSALTGDDRPSAGGSTSGALGKPGPEIVRVAGKVGSLCTGVGIAGDRVLTAKHCVSGLHAEALVGEQSNAVHSGCVLAEHADLDLALVAIGGTLSNTVPLKAGVAFPTDKKAIQISGFSDWSGWSGSSLVSGVGNTTFGVDSTTGDTSSLPCDGDSGGPAYFNGELVGIASKLAPPSFDCKKSAAQYTYVGDASGWVTPYKNDSSCDEVIRVLQVKLDMEKSGPHLDLFRMIRPPGPRP